MKKLISILLLFSCVLTTLSCKKSEDSTTIPTTPQETPKTKFVIQVQIGNKSITFDEKWNQNVGLRGFVSYVYNQYSKPQPLVVGSGAYGFSISVSKGNDWLVLLVYPYMSNSSGKYNYNCYNTQDRLKDAPTGIYTISDSIFVSARCWINNVRYSNYYDVQSPEGPISSYTFDSQSIIRIDSKATKGSLKDLAPYDILGGSFSFTLKTISDDYKTPGTQTINCTGTMVYNK